MTVQVIDKGWKEQFKKALEADRSSLSLICPFIKTKVVKELLSYKPQNIRVITRFNLADFAAGVSDVGALKSLLDAGATVRGVRNLHTKLYIFGEDRAIITSANLTASALSKNHEFGIVSDDVKVVAECQRYFDDLWQRSGPDLNHYQATEWDKTITKNHTTGGRPIKDDSLKDFGVDAGIMGTQQPVQQGIFSDASQAFVKLLGNDDNRAPMSSPIFDELSSGGCHWAVGYPTNRRPRNVEDGDVIFLGRLTLDPNDIRIFGRAIGMRHKPGRDDATKEYIQERSWKKDWSRYVRVHHGEFITGPMENGISLNELMDTLGADSFASTQSNSAQGRGNTDPRRSYRQQAAVKLSNEGFLWITERLEAAFQEHGMITQAELDSLDWPPAPV